MDDTLNRKRFMELAALKEDTCEFVVWGGSDLHYPKDIQAFIDWFAVSGKDIIEGDVFIRSSTGQVKFTPLAEFQANWFMMDHISDNGLATCALVEDTLEIVRWAGVDASYPYWFTILMFEFIDADADNIPYYSNDFYSEHHQYGTFVLADGDIFAKNRLDEVKIYPVDVFEHSWCTVR